MVAETGTLPIRDSVEEALGSFRPCGEPPGLLRYTKCIIQNV